MELRVAGTLNGLVHELSDMVEIEDSGPDWLRYRVADARQSQPWPAAPGDRAGAWTWSHWRRLRRNLEDIYLQVVQEDEAQEAQANGDAR